MAAIDRGWIDQILSRGIDVIMSIPSLIFALMLLTISGSSVWALIIIIAVLDSTRVFRLTRRWRPVLLSWTMLKRHV